MKKALSMFLLAAAILSFASCADAAAPLEVYSCRSLASVPRQSGSFCDDPAWMNSPAGSASAELGTGKRGPAETAFKIGYAAKCLYVGVDCLAGKEKVDANESDELWGGDSIELFISPFQNDAYLQFIVSASGAKRSFLCADSEKVETSDSGWKVSVNKLDGGYSVLFEIPWETLLAVPGKKAAWTANICRNFSSGRRSVSWTPVESVFHEPWNFGRIAFEDAVTAQAANEAIRKTMEGEAVKAEYRKAACVKKKEERLLETIGAISRFEARLADAKSTKAQTLLAAAKAMRSNVLANGKTLPEPDLDAMLSDAKQLHRDILMELVCFRD